MVSLETSLPKASVLNPRTISESLTVSVSVNNVADVPPIVILPATFKLRLIWTSLLTCKSFPIVTFPPIVGFGANEMTGVDPSPVPPVTSISFAVPEIDFT